MKKISKGRRKKIINKKRIITHKSRKKNLKSNKIKKIHIFAKSEF